MVDSSDLDHYDIVRNSIIQTLIELRWDLYLIIERGVSDPQCKKLFGTPQDSRGVGICGWIWTGIRNKCRYVDRILIYDALMARIRLLWQSKGRSTMFPIPGVGPHDASTMYALANSAITSCTEPRMITLDQFNNYCMQRIELIDEIIPLIRAYDFGSHPERFISKS